MYSIICFNFLKFTFGPQHPASHGVLCVFVILFWEFILCIDFVFGYLHRATEKLIEYKTIEQNMPYFDRLDYVSVLCNEHLFCICFEVMLRCIISLSFITIRTILLEFTRVFNTLLALGCMFMDLGSLSPLLWSFEERDKLMTFFDLFIGCRMHLAAFFICGIFDDFCFGLIDLLLCLLVTFICFINFIDFFITHNRLFYLRLRGLGQLDIWDIIYTSQSGLLIRACGISYDIRLLFTYDIYWLCIYKIFISINGDGFDRSLLRIGDARYSLIISQQCISYNMSYLRTRIFNSCWMDYLLSEHLIESMVMLFYTTWSLLCPGICYISVEHPKGEYILSIVFNSGICMRMRIRASDYIHLFLMDIMLRGSLLHDLAAILGNIDVVFGSVDR